MPGFKCSFLIIFERSTYRQNFGVTKDISTYPFCSNISTNAPRDDENSLINKLKAYSYNYYVVKRRANKKYLLQKKKS